MMQFLGMVPEDIRRRFWHGVVAVIVAVSNGSCLVSLRWVSPDAS
jgi:hypothetical protein